MKAIYLYVIVGQKKILHSICETYAIRVLSQFAKRGLILQNLCYPRAIRAIRVLSALSAGYPRAIRALSTGYPRAIRALPPLTQCPPPPPFYMWWRGWQIDQCEAREYVTHAPRLRQPSEGCLN